MLTGGFAMNQGWPGFVIGHQIKICYFLTFKVLRGDVYRVTFLDYSMIEVVKKCLENDPALDMIDV
jgi:hypothetical protein